jgi:biotin operon repressor
MDLRSALADAFDLRGFVTSRQLQHALGISRQAVWLQVRRLVESGELKIESAGRGVRYVPGPGSARRGGIVRGDQETDFLTGTFWTQLVEEAPYVGYVCVRLASRGTQRKEHGQALVAELPHQRLIILDFDGVEAISGTFAEAVLFSPLLCARVMPINASTSVRRTLERATRCNALRPTSEYGT